MLTVLDHSALVSCHLSGSTSIFIVSKKQILFSLCLICTELQSINYFLLFFLNTFIWLFLHLNSIERFLISDVFLYIYELLCKSLFCLNFVIDIYFLDY